MHEYIPMSIPEFKGNEWKYIKECIDTGWVSSVGKFVTRFEDEICNYTGAKHAIACVNGTAALHVSLIIAGVKPDDEVIVPVLTFIAPVNAINYINAHPVFMDCDNYYNIDAEKTCEFLELETVIKNNFTYNKSTGRRISAIIPVHIFGNAVQFTQLFDICKERNIKIIEDATESLGTSYITGSQSGSYTGTIGDLGCLSFNGNKIITTGGGGMILSNDSGHAERARYLTTQAKDDGLYYTHNEIGYNYRMTNISAALGVAQLERLPEYISKKKHNYHLYSEKINHIHGIELSQLPPYADNNNWLYAIRINDTIYGKNRDQLIHYLEDNNIQSRPVWKLNHEQKPYRNCQTYKIENAPSLYNNTLNIPSSVNLTKDNVDYIASVLDWKK